MKTLNDSLIGALSICAVLMFLPVLAPEDETSETEPDINTQEQESAEDETEGELGSQVTTEEEKPESETEEEAEKEERDIAEIFVPSEAISEDYAAPFPVDI